MDLEQKAKRISEQFDEILEQIHETNTSLFRERLSLMTDEQLGYEWSDRGGDQWEFDNTNTTMINFSTMYINKIASGQYAGNTPTYLRNS